MACRALAYTTEEDAKRQGNPIIKANFHKQAEALKVIVRKINPAG